MKRRVRGWSPGKGFKPVDGWLLGMWFRYGNTTTRFVIVVWAKTNMLAWDGTPWDDYDALELWTVDTPTHGDDSFAWTLKDKCQRVTWIVTDPECSSYGTIVKREPVPADLVRQRARAKTLRLRRQYRLSRRERREWRRHG